MTTKSTASEFGFLRVARTGLALLAFGLLSALPLSSAVNPAPAPASKALTWADLANHPERWPATTTLKAEQKFSDVTLKAGTQVKINAVNARGAELIAPAPQDFAFTVTPKECDLLEAANAQWSAWTPEQRTLTLNTIQRDMSLWPGKVTLTQSAKFGAFTLKEGETYRLLKISGNEAALYVPGQSGQQLVPIGSTDVVARARAIAAVPRAQRPGRMIEVLDGLMVDADGKAIPIQAADYYVHYWSASTCPRCAIFTPKLIDHYNTKLANQKNVAFFGSSTDVTMPLYFEYVKKTKMPWPTLPDQSKGVLMALGELGVIEIPGMVVFDKFGKLIMSTSKMPGAPLPVAEAALAKLDDQIRPSAGGGN